MAAHLLADPAAADAARIALYAALPDELPTRPLFDRLRALGKACLLPRIRGDGLEFAAVEDWAALERGAFGVLAPPPDCAAEALGPEDLAVLPGVAFDSAGRRLGRGGGYYDRAFAAPGGPRLVGAAYALQLVAEVPADSRDRAVDAIVTEQGLRWLARET